MYFARFLILTLALMIGACGETMDDMRASGEDKRVDTNTADAGSQDSITTNDFTLPDIDNSPFNLYAKLTEYDAVVLYFTMWCPICDSHMSHLKSSVAPDFDNALFVVVDFVSGSVENAKTSASASGYRNNSPFTIIADADMGVTNQYHGTMGTTVVIDSSGKILMNEDYKTGNELRGILEAL